ncbi:MAG: LysM peptidoglycan-binding domain-containing protein [Chloroflexi bacterium]|nr:LysM peptidoglycan-binding domain-containing protein [Chloroflexota bacterium]
MRRMVLISVIVLSLLLLAFAPAYAKPATWSTLGYHTVKAGETIWCIGRAYGVSPAAIISYNGIVNPALIHPGLVLAIPNAYATIAPGPTCARQFGGTPPSECTCASYHTVVAGENLYRISLHYGVSMWRIAECNHILNLNYIRAGASLCIPAS